MNQKMIIILAISGGVDSVVLLDKLARRYKEEDQKAPKYIVAHFDHGIRPDSQKDAEYVKGLADKYQLEFELGQGKLGLGASEAIARDARYEFLRKVKIKHDAEKIITAHHQDDLVETMVINMIRGTGARGLNPMQGHQDILRPLIHTRKKDLLKYAKDNQIIWQEDSTNSDEKYMRNYVRLNIMPKLESRFEDFLEINNKVEKLFFDIDSRITLILPKQNLISRSWFIGLSFSVQKELIRAWLVRCGVVEIDSALINRVVIASKTLPIGKKIDINNVLWLQSEKQNILITSK